MKGTALNCLADFLGPSTTLAHLDLLAEFAHVTPATVITWRKAADPKGETLLKIEVFLELNGYEVQEFLDLPGEVTRQFARLIAYGILSIDDARNALKYTNPQEVYRVALRGTSLVKERQERMENIVAARQGDIAEQFARWTARLGDIATEAPRTHGIQTVDLPAQPPSIAPAEPLALATSGTPDEEAALQAIVTTTLALAWETSAVPDRERAIGRVKRDLSPARLGELQRFLEATLNS